jgi:hypothetical protein
VVANSTTAWEKPLMVKRTKRSKTISDSCCHSLTYVSQFLFTMLPDIEDVFRKSFDDIAKAPPAFLENHPTPLVKGSLNDRSCKLMDV